MKFTLKTNEIDSAMIEAYTKDNRGHKMLTFVVHEDCLEDDNIFYFLDKYGECEVELEITG